MHYVMILASDAGTELTFMDALAKYNDVINTFVWTKVGVWLLIAVGVAMTVLTGFFQVSHLKHWWKKTIGSMFDKKVISHTDGKAISPFQALCTALAATIGTGNIAGVAAAIHIGGAGAVFWMWIAAFFGMMTNYSENILGIYYRRRNEHGEWSGGAMYYIKDGMGKMKGCKQISSVLAVLFSIFAILASFGIGSMGQINKIVANITEAFDIPVLSSVTVLGEGDSAVSLYSIILGVILMALAALIILGGLQRIAGFAEKVVPFMVIAFVFGSLVIIGVNISHVGEAFKAIFVNAFNPIAALGGGVGVVVKTVMTQGFKRGVFSNEAGLGSSVMVHSNSNVVEPVQQGMWGIFEVFADTIVVCTMTALVVLTSGVYNLETGEITAASDAVLVGAAFDSVFKWGHIGSKFIAIAMFLFAFTTVLGWSHYGTKAWEYLFGTKSTIIFKVIHIITIMFGAILTSSLAWDISDTFNGLMMMPNLIGVIVLCGTVRKLTKNYIDRNLKKKDVEPMLNAFPEIQAQEEKRMASE